LEIGALPLCHWLSLVEIKKKKITNPKPLSLEMDALPLHHWLTLVGKKKKNLLCIFVQHLVNFPLEQMSVCCQQPITRLPSLPLLSHLLHIHGNGAGEGWGKEVDPKSVFYLLNPDGDLEHSVELLGPHFSR
jgi:hypothetical protein